MNRLTIIIHIALLLCIAISATAQEDVHFDEFKLVTRSGAFEGKDGVLTADSFSGKRTDGTAFAIPRGEIRNLYKRSGSKAGKYAAAGAGIGLTGALLGVMQAKADAASSPYVETDDDKIMPLVIGFTVAGGLIGGLVGASKETYERVPTRVTPQVSYRPQGFQVALSIRF